MVGAGAANVASGVRVPHLGWRAMAEREGKTEQPGPVLAGEALAGFPGAALLLGPGTAVAAANADGAALVTAGPALLQDLVALAAETLGSQSARLVTPASLPGGEALLLPL